MPTTCPTSRRADLGPLALPPRALAALRRAVPALHRWFGEAARDLPWRRTNDPYAIWVAEAMLQQTQVRTVLPYYTRWMAALPTVDALAAADAADVLRLWEGLGYYSRAVNLQRAARVVREHHGGTIPAAPDAFRALPGVGAYTTAAVLSIAFGRDLAVVDGNVRRVLARLVALEADPRRAPHAAALDALAAALLPPGTAAVHNQALMELGALCCTPRAPRCAACPLAVACRAWAAGRTAELPRRPPRRALPHHEVAIGVVFHRGRCLIDQRPYGALLGGLWEFPGGKIEAGESAEQALHRVLGTALMAVPPSGVNPLGHPVLGAALMAVPPSGVNPLTVRLDAALPAVRHAYSHFSVTLHPWICTLRAAPRAASQRWVRPTELGDFPMPRATRKVIADLECYLAERERGRVRVSADHPAGGGGRRSLISTSRRWG